MINNWKAPRECKPLSRLTTPSADYYYYAASLSERSGLYSSHFSVNDLSVGLSVCPVHCGKTAARIRMQFGIVDRTGPGMRQVYSGVSGSVYGKGYFWGEFGARHCNYWRLYGVRVLQCRDAVLFLSLIHI